MSAMNYNGIDLSFSLLTDAALADPRIEVVTQDLWTGNQQPAPRVVNLRRALNAGKKIAGYFAVSSGQDGPYHARMAARGMPSDIWAALECVWCDVELDGVPIGEVRAAVDAMSGMTRHANIIYTRRSHWEAVYSRQESETLRDCLLVDARYPVAGQTPAFTPYGCWEDESRVLGVQVSGTTMLGGTEVDLNLMDLSKLEGQRMYTDAEIDAKVGECVRQLGVLGKDQFDLTADVQGVFKFAYEHATKTDLHSGDAQIDIAPLQAKIDELQGRLDKGAADLQAAAAAFAKENT